MNKSTCHCRHGLGRGLGTLAVTGLLAVAAMAAAPSFGQTIVPHGDVPIDDAPSKDPDPAVKRPAGPPADEAPAAAPSPAIEPEVKPAEPPAGEEPVPVEQLPGPKSQAQRTTIIPDAWRGSVMEAKPDMTGIDKLRFVMDSEYPPFQYFDEEGKLTGFNADLAQAICDELQVECVIEDEDWDDLLPSLEKGEADAVLSSLRISKANLEHADFTERYFATPARFIARKESRQQEIGPEALKGARIAVVSETGHEAYLKTYFPGAEILTFETPEEAELAVRTGKADLAFGDAVGLTFWLNGVTSQGCCEFRGGPYMDAKFFGEGVGIAVRKGNQQMVQLLNYALQRIHQSGRYEELILRYFPINVF